MAWEGGWAGSGDHHIQTLELREVGHTKSLVPVYKYLFVGLVCFFEAQNVFLEGYKKGQCL